MQQAKLIMSSAASEDFIGINESLIFTPTSDTLMCFDIVVIQDGIVETIELFCVMANSTIGSASTVIIIFDTDRKFPQLFGQFPSNLHVYDGCCKV